MIPKLPILEATQKLLMIVLVLRRHPTPQIQSPKKIVAHSLGSIWTRALSMASQVFLKLKGHQTVLVLALTSYLENQAPSYLHVRV